MVRAVALVAQDRMTRAFVNIPPVLPRKAAAGRRGAVRQRVMVITEFDAGDPEVTMHALAGEILEYRRALRLLAKAIGWADAGAPFALIAPGPYWRPRRAIDGSADLVWVRAIELGSFACTGGERFELTPWE